MKKILFVVITAVAAAAVIFAYREMSQERAREAKGEKPIAAESRVSRNAAGESVLTLTEEGQQRLGLKTAPLAAAQLAPEVKAFGKVLDPAALATVAAESASAHAAAEASQKEFTRLKALVEQNNASARALEAAEAAAQRDEALAGAVRVRLVTSWGKAIAGREDLRAFVKSLAAGERALVRLDLRAGEVLKNEPTGARVFVLADDNSPVEAEFLGTAPNVDAQTQGQGFLFLVAAHALSFKPGGAVIGFLNVGGDAQSGVLIPRGAVLRFNGQPWIYLQTGEQTFTRREVTLDRPLAEGWFTTRGVTAGDAVVVAGAQMLLSEEQKYQIHMGD